MDDLIIRIEKSIDEVLVTLGNVVVRLSSPQLTRNSEQHAALALSVNRFSVCANRSTDPRVRRLAENLRNTTSPRLRLISSR